MPDRHSLTTDSSVTTPAIEARDLTRHYGGVPVIDRVTVTLPPGAHVALLGANGAGKTTLLGLLAALLTPHGGSAWIGGHAAGTTEARRIIGVLAHQPMLYEELSPLENMQFFARLYDVTEAATRAETLLRRLGLWSRRHDPTASLSRGYHQRLAIARALVHAPPVLLLDEPETGLDTEGLALLDELLMTAPGTTVLAATHRIDRVDDWADGVLTLDRGRIAERRGSAAADPAPALGGAR